MEDKATRDQATQIRTLKARCDALEAIIISLGRRLHQDAPLGIGLDLAANGEQPRTGGLRPLSASGEKRRLALDQAIMGHL
ncbi:MAG: hypothetical protein ACXU82_03615 [Caulobacteraceae bacterium]